MLKWIPGLVGALCCITATASDNDQKPWSGHGYIKFMTIESIDMFENTVNQNFIHHRHNFRYDFKHGFTAKVEMRNRLFYGEFLRMAGGFGELLDSDPGAVDMSWTLVDNRNVVLHSTLDRAWLNWTSEKWDVGIGRQRINWGVNLVWNPNDLFNTLNFTDFDYEERPGSDALRVQHFLSGMSSVEVAYKVTGNFRTDVGAVMYKFNKSLYDVQVLAGKYQTDAVAGLGWAGNLGEAGFKGEVTYFEPLMPDPIYAKRAIAATAAVDYSFKKGIYLMGSYLYNTANTSDITGLLALGNTTTNPLSARQLMPNEHSFFIQASKAFTPLLSASMASIYAIDLHGLLLFPTVAYSLATNLEASLVAQTFLFLETQSKTHIGSGIFLRFKYSY